MTYALVVSGRLEDLEMAVTSLVQWYGGNRMHAEMPGRLIGKQDLIGVLFAGGLTEIPHFNARQILVNDKHAELYNLFHVLRLWPDTFPERMKECIYHPHTLDDAKRGLSVGDSSFNRACWYFIVNWMTRCSGGTEKETEGSLAMRWTASGGSSIARWNAAVEGLKDWSEMIRSKCECTCLDWRDFVKKWNDRKGHAIYLDPPWIGAGDDYVHKFLLHDHRDLATWANGLKSGTTVVVRHSDHPLYRELYAVENGWEWFPVDAKNQAGSATGEVLIRRVAA